MKNFYLRDLKHVKKTQIFDMPKRLDMNYFITIYSEDLAKYQSQTLAANSLSGKEENEVVISFDSAPGVSSATSRVITDRVRAATAAYAARLDRQ